MKDFFDCIENRIVYPILIKNNGNSYLTLYYYTERSDSILHNDAKNLLYFQSAAEMARFYHSTGTKSPVSSIRCIMTLE